MSLDLAAEVVAALRSPDGRTALADALRPVIAAEVQAALAHRGEAEILDGPALARLLGVTPAALRMRLRRGSDLAAVARTVDGRRVWRRADVDLLLARGR